MPAMLPQPQSAGTTVDSNAVNKYGTHDPLAPLRSMSDSPTTITPKPRGLMSGTNTSAPMQWFTGDLGGHPGLSKATFGSIVKFADQAPPEPLRSDRGARFLVGDS